MQEHPFQRFLQEFVPQVARKSRQLNTAAWILETTGLPDAAALKADLDTELRILYSDPKTFEQLRNWEKDPLLIDPLLKRQVNVLRRAFEGNLLSKELLEEIAQKEAALSQSYNAFRPLLEGKEVSENDIREILKSETDVEQRMAAWEASKEIGALLAPQILGLVQLRNRAAKTLGYSDYFQMQLALQEVDAAWLQKTLDDLAQQSDDAYSSVLDEIDRTLSKRFNTSNLGPWSWSEPFCQEDPLDNAELDALVEGVDIASRSAAFFGRLGLDAEPILSRSDMVERPGKNQHAFCIHIDRQGDIRTLNNVRPSIK